MPPLKISVEYKRYEITVQPIPFWSKLNSKRFFNIVKCLWQSWFILFKSLYPQSIENAQLQVPLRLELFNGQRSSVIVPKNRRGNLSLLNSQAIFVYAVLHLADKRTSYKMPQTEPNSVLKRSKLQVNINRR